MSKISYILENPNNRFCLACGTKKIIRFHSTFDERTGKKKAYLICPKGCNIFPNECRYYHGDHREDFFGWCKCGYHYPSNEWDKYAESGEEIMKRIIKEENLCPIS